MAGAGLRRLNRLLRLPPGILRGRLIQGALAPLYGTGLYASSLPGRGDGAIQPVAPMPGRAIRRAGARSPRACSAWRANRSASPHRWAGP